MVDNLWAPWRMEFIADKRFKEGEGPCVFCEMKEATPSEESLVLKRGRTLYVVMNRFPYATGHLLLVPYRHEAALKNLDADTHRELMEWSAKGMEILGEALNAEGFNCGLNIGRVAGCGILDHLHFHIVPRWNGDVNFLPVLSDTRAMPEYLHKTWQRLVDHFQRIA